jgi:ribosomal protein L7/L12
MSITHGERITTINHILREVPPLLQERTFIPLDEIERLTGGGVHSQDLQEILFTLLQQPIFQGWAMLRHTPGAVLVKVPAEILPEGWLTATSTPAQSAYGTTRGIQTLVDVTYFMVPHGSLTGRTGIPLPHGPGETDIFLQVPFRSKIHFIKIIKALQECYPYSLREAKALVDHLHATETPIKIFANLTETDARNARAVLGLVANVGASEADFENAAPLAEPAFPQEAEVLQYLLDSVQRLRNNLFGGDYGWLYQQVTKATGASVWDLEKWDKEHGYTYHDPDEAVGFIVDVPQAKRRLAALQEAMRSQG